MPRELLSSDALRSIRADLESLAVLKSRKDDLATGLAVMAALYPEVERALDAGATHANVIEALQKHGVCVTKTNFGQHLYRLRQLFPRPERKVTVDPKQVAGVRADLAGLAAGITEDSGKPVVVRQKKGRAASRRIPMRDKVLIVARAINLVAASPEKSLPNIEAALRGELGSGWTIRVAVQCAVGRPYGEWLDADWQDDQVRSLVESARLIALKVIDTPREESVSKAIRAAAKRLKKRV